MILWWVALWLIAHPVAGCIQYLTMACQHESKTSFSGVGNNVSALSAMTHAYHTCYIPPWWRIASHLLATATSTCMSIFVPILQLLGKTSMFIFAPGASASGNLWMLWRFTYHDPVPMMSHNCSDAMDGFTTWCNGRQTVGTALGGMEYCMHTDVSRAHHSTMMFCYC